MSKYSIGQPDITGRVWIEDIENGKVFNGYDFMGSIDWVDYGGDACWMTPEEAEQIISDLEAADESEQPADPILEMFQRSLDAAVQERDASGRKWNEMANDGKHSDAECHRAYIRYQREQGFLEGLTNAIFIAGYRIVSSVNSTKLTVTK